MYLKNPNMNFKGLSVPDNVFEITTRTITPDGGFSVVTVILNCYSHTSRENKLQSWEIRLINMPLIPDPGTYLVELQRQYPDRVLSDDGTLLKDYIQIEEEV